MSITGKVALVTGSAQGIGRGIALRLAKDGANVAVLDVKPDKLEAVAKEIKALGRKSIAITADVSDRDQVFAAVDRTEKELGGFDIIVNNAGICYTKLLEESTPADVEKIFKINVNGVLWGILAAAAKFRARKQKGKIINASSQAGHEATALVGLYSATKFAVRGLTQAAAAELAEEGITVNAYCPGIVQTEMMVGIGETVDKMKNLKSGEALQQFVEMCALGRGAYGRIQMPEDVAGFVSYLAGPDSDQMTGQSVLIDGGMLFR